MGGWQKMNEAILVIILTMIYALAFVFAGWALIQIYKREAELAAINKQAFELQKLAYTQKELRQLKKSL